MSNGWMAALWILLIPGLACGQPQTSAPGAVQGAVKDASGSAIAGAIVNLELSASTFASGRPRTAITDQAGEFRFAAVEPGDYKVTISAAGFATWTANVAAGSGVQQPSVSVVLQVAAVSSSVSVTVPQRERAAQQLKNEEKQRLLGVFPEFFVSYESDAVSLTAAQKFHLGWKTITDPVTFLGTGLAAGIEQKRNNYPEFGQGTEGYAKRFGAQYANRVSEVVIGHVVMQSIFHQDPRYFYKGTGSFGSRLLYAIGNAFIRRGDNGHWQPDYSDVLGGLAASEISTLYYPASSRPVKRLADGVLLGFAGRAGGNLLREFVLRNVTTHVPPAAAGLAQRVLPEGTQVLLISADDWSTKPPENGAGVAFTLARDLEVDGLIVAPIGSSATGRASFTGAAGAGGQPAQVGLEKVRLRIGQMDVPLRSTPLRGGVAPLEYHRLENSGRIAITLYLAQSVTLPPAR